MTPRYPHDCATCKFLGRDGEHDLYWCRTPAAPVGSIIARYGTAGDYHSGPVETYLTMDLREQIPHECGPAVLMRLAKKLLYDGNLMLVPWKPL